MQIYAAMQALDKRINFHSIANQKRSQDGRRHLRWLNRRLYAMRGGAKKQRFEQSTYGLQVACSESNSLRPKCFCSEAITRISASSVRLRCIVYGIWHKHHAVCVNMYVISQQTSLRYLALLDKRSNDRDGRLLERHFADVYIMYKEMPLMLCSSRHVYQSLRAD
jgi:hypothetical protein